MVAITLPSGEVRCFDAPITGAEIALRIGPGLAKSALAAVVNGNVWDLSRPINDNATVSILTDKDDGALELIRHDAAHVLAQAVQELYSDVQVTIGPSIENGFYYDFAREQPFSSENLRDIEARMREIVDRDLPIVREVWDRDQAIAHFKHIGENYKAEIIDDLPVGEVITIYRQGDWKDLCRGPHLPSTGKVGKAFKLLKVAGAYWRGNSDNEMLQRIYGTAWATKRQLDGHLTMLEEAEKRDHRRLGKQMDLFHFQEEAPGAVFWLPKGWTIYRTLQNYMRARLQASGYQEVNTPQIIDRKLWERSGHWDKFHDSMFTFEVGDRVYAVKPMSCPGHVQIFNQGIRSYRELPFRLSEFGAVNRNESSGSLHGLMRVRSFTQDDAHMFCTERQIEAETRLFYGLLSSIYSNLGFSDVRVRFSDRPEIRAGSDAAWDKAEQALRQAAEAVGMKTIANPGEGAFYGPKLEFVLRDAIGRQWQCGSLQVDYVLPERLGVEYVTENGESRHPVMLHHVILGSFERFIGILIEDCAGHLPLWLSPVQATVAAISAGAAEYASEVAAVLRKAGVRTELDIRNETLNYKIREHSNAKVPVILVVGSKEAENRAVALRRLGVRRQESLALDDAVDKLVKECQEPCG